jgi:hypothetical protein
VCSAHSSKAAAQCASVILQLVCSWIFTSETLQQQLCSSLHNVCLPCSPPKKPSVLGLDALSVTVYAADGKRESSKEGKLGDALLKAIALSTGQSVEVRATSSSAAAALQQWISAQQHKDVHALAAGQCYPAQEQPSRRSNGHSRQAGTMPMQQLLCIQCLFTPVPSIRS